MTQPLNFLGERLFKPLDSPPLAGGTKGGCTLNVPLQTRRGRQNINNNARVARPASLGGSHFPLSVFLFPLSLILLFSSPSFALTSTVNLSGDFDPNLKEQIRASLTLTLNRLVPANWDDIKSKFTPGGLKSLAELSTQTKMVNVNPLYETDLLALPGGGWEVRNIKVLLDTRGLPGNPYQHLVFSFTPEGLIADVRFAIEQQQYENVFKPSLHLQDAAHRQQILQFVEIFRTAYNRKDLDFLKGVYSDDALIIVGKVLKPKAGSGDLLEHSHLTRERIAFIRESKQEYITKLQKVFANNEFIKVGFADIELLRHPTIDQIYGVTLRQDWRSSSYEDHGWLFLMIDFRKPEQPLIHVRSWQPERFSDGSVVSLGDFEVIE